MNAADKCPWDHYQDLYSSTMNCLSCRELCNPNRLSRSACENLCHDYLSQLKEAITQVMIADSTNFTSLTSELQRLLILLGLVIILIAMVVFGILLRKKIRECLCPMNQRHESQEMELDAMEKQALTEADGNIRVAVPRRMSGGERPNYQLEKWDDIPTPDESIHPVDNLPD